MLGECRAMLTIVAFSGSRRPSCKAWTPPPKRTAWPNYWRKSAPASWAGQGCLPRCLCPGRLSTIWLLPLRARPTSPRPALLSADGEPWPAARRPPRAGSDCPGKGTAAQAEASRSGSLSAADEHAPLLLITHPIWRGCCYWGERRRQR
jgi:hypothetical protein